MRFLNFFFILFFAAPVLLNAQDLGTWNIVNVKYQLNDKWSLFGEAQIRSLKFYNNFHYYEYKAGFIYQINKQLNFGLGAGDYDTYREGGDFLTPKNNDEFRLWPQIVFANNLGKIKVEHRYRAEFRFTSNGFRNRFRYRFALIYNFGKSNYDIKPHQVSLSNELFFTNNEPYFERNRTIIGYTYKLNKTIAFQIGYLHQFDYKINDETGRDFLLTGLNINLKSKKVKVDDAIPIIPTDI